MTNIVKFFVLSYACKKTKRRKNIVKFEEYLLQMEERRAREQREAINNALAQGLREKTHEESVSALYACLTFVGGVSDVLLPASTEKYAELAL